MFTVPLHKPRAVQALFTSDSALLSWSPPEFNQGTSIVVVVAVIVVVVVVVVVFAVFVVYMW